MKKIILILLSIISISMASANSTFDTVIAQVKLTKTELIKLSYVENKIKLAEAQFGKEFTANEKDFILDSIISNELIKQAAKRDGVVITEDMVINMLKQQAGQDVSDQQIKDAVAVQYKQPWEIVVAALIEQLSLQEYIKLAGAEDLKKFAVTPSESDIKAYYNKAKTTKFVSPDMVRVNHIFFATNGKTDEEIVSIKKKSEDVLLQIKQGKKSFDDLVQEVSDDRNSAKNGGELGFVYRDNETTVKILGNDFINEVFELPMDGVHGVIKSNSGYHIVMITEKRSARILNLSDTVDPSTQMTVEQYITRVLQQESVTQGFSQVTEIVIKRLKEEAVIKIIDKSVPWN